MTKKPAEEWTWIVPFQAMILPLATVLTLGISYGVRLDALTPFLEKLGEAAYHWIFVAAIGANNG